MREWYFKLEVGAEVIRLMVSGNNDRRRYSCDSWIGGHFGSDRANGIFLRRFSLWDLFGRTQRAPHPKERFLFIDFGLPFRYLAGLETAGYLMMDAIYTLS